MRIWGVREDLSIAKLRLLALKLFSFCVLGCQRPSISSSGSSSSRVAAAAATTAGGVIVLDKLLWHRMKARTF